MPSSTNELKFVKISVCETVSVKKKANSTVGITHEFSA